MMSRDSRQKQKSVAGKEGDNVFKTVAGTGLMVRAVLGVLSGKFTRVGEVGSECACALALQG